MTNFLRANPLKDIHFDFGFGSEQALEKPKNANNAAAKPIRNPVRHGTSSENAFEIYRKVHYNGDRKAAPNEPEFRQH